MTTGTVALVVGAGMVGSAVVASLHASGAAVTCADLDRDRAARLADRTGCGHRAVDLDSWESTRDAVTQIRPDLVVHAAGRIQAGGGCEQRRLIADAAGQAYTLASVAADVGVPTLLLVSSLGIYSGHIGDGAGNTPIAVPETLAPRPDSAYGAAKAAAESATLAGCAFRKTRVLIGRLCGVYGGRPEARGRLNMALLRLVADHLAGRVVRVPSSLGGREYLHADDAGTGLTQLAAVGPAAGLGIVNIGTGTLLGAADVAAAFTALGGVAVADPEPAGPRWHLDTGLAAAALGFRPRIPLADGLRQWIGHLRGIEDRRETELRREEPR